MSRLLETFRVGGLEISAISDGAPDRPLGGFFYEVPVEEWTKALGLSSPEELVPFNMGAFLVRGDGHVTLVDSGLGVRARQMGIPGGGELPQRLAELGVRPEEIDTVVHTHLHFDHCGWDIDGANGNVPMFPNADVHVSERELNYWFDPANDGKPQVADARAAMTPLREAGRVKTFEGRVRRFGRPHDDPDARAYAGPLLGAAGL
jgi:glyoxylase-like metal-dependent hydrolase (beta-lactamase superfamily II)